MSAVGREPSRSPLSCVGRVLLEAGGLAEPDRGEDMRGDRHRELHRCAERAEQQGIQRDRELPPASHWDAEQVGIASSAATTTIGAMGTPARMAVSMNPPRPKRASRYRSRYSLLVP